MPTIKNMILYSLFIMNSINTSLYCQDENIQNNDEEIILVFDNSDEIYPLENTEVLDVIINQEVISDELLDPMVLPIEVENLMQEALDVIYEASNNHDSFDDASSMDEYSDMQCEDDPVLVITKDQLEEILYDQYEQIQEHLLLNDQVNSDCSTIPIDSSDIIISLDNGILLENQENKRPSHDLVVAMEVDMEVDDDDDLIPVPHDLINSVKKANKQKKKLEKLERKEKANAYKIFKKKNK